MGRFAHCGLYMRLAWVYAQLGLLALVDPHAADQALAKILHTTVDARSNPSPM